MIIASKTIQVCYNETNRDWCVSRCPGYRWRKNYYCSIFNTLLEKQPGGHVARCQDCRRLLDNRKG